MLTLQDGTEDSPLTSDSTKVTNFSILLGQFRTCTYSCEVKRNNLSKIYCTFNLIKVCEWVDSY